MIRLKKYQDTATYFMLPIVNTHEKKKNKYWFNKESNKFANQVDLTPKEIDIKDKVLKLAKI